MRISYQFLLVACGLFYNGLLCGARKVHLSLNLRLLDERQQAKLHSKMS